MERLRADAERRNRSFQTAVRAATERLQSSWDADRAALESQCVPNLDPISVYYIKLNCAFTS